ncbi:hypothetical protein NPIL_420561 [Nephila pilipes]|uniref:Uncharacterized protein n=1 Tax=Nephila pilipes TaxID=299642 RepID=A0A8X6TYM3_NEPPI|nr:hypothetical protein NPIL_420561 [Nephila pilipes]
MSCLESRYLYIEFKIKVKLKPSSTNTLVDKQLQLEFRDNKDNLREAVKEEIKKVQNENKMSYNLRQKPPAAYNIYELVTFKRSNTDTDKSSAINTLDSKKCSSFDGVTKTNAWIEYLKP